MWGEGFLLCHSHVSVAVNTTACLPPRGSSLLSWECLVSCRVRCLPGFLCAHGPFDETQKQVLETKTREDCPEGIFVFLPCDQVIF